MYAGKLVFAQVMECATWHTFRRLVAKYQGDFNVRTFTCLDQFLSMAFAQITYRESLRDIEACFEAHATKAYQIISHSSACTSLRCAYLTRTRAKREASAPAEPSRRSIRRHARPGNSCARRFTLIG
jgi:hypothetical protein